MSRDTVPLLLWIVLVIVLVDLVVEAVSIGSIVPHLVEHEPASGDFGTPILLLDTPTEFNRRWSTPRHVHVSPKVERPFYRAAAIDRHAYRTVGSKDRYARAEQEHKQPQSAHCRSASLHRKFPG